MNTILQNRKILTKDINEIFTSNNNIDFIEIEKNLINKGLDDLKLNKTSTHDEVKRRFELKFKQK